jgi:hypothetical protein
MIGITISAEAYAAIAAKLPTAHAVEQEIAPVHEYRVWLPRAVVNHLRARRIPGSLLAMSSLARRAAANCANAEASFTA